MQITTALQASERDADAIAAGTTGWTLMLAAGSAAAQLIIDLYSDRLMYGAVVYAGTGNNGGDAYVVAARLVEAGARVSIVSAGNPATTDAKRALSFYESAVATRSRAGAFLAGDELDFATSSQVIIDGLLGTGQRGALREPELAFCTAINARQNSAVVVALDVPTGVNATTGDIAMHAVRANHTIAFGTMKRAHVLQRSQTGTVSVVDIGLGQHASKNDGAWRLATTQTVGALVPHIEWNAYKGTRGRLAIAGGAAGMAGAVVLSARAALRAGAGLVYTHTSLHSVTSIQVAAPQVVAGRWNALPADVHAIVIGPGLGRNHKSMKVLNAMTAATVSTPTVLDADALTLLATQAETDDNLDEQLHDLSAADSTISRLQQLTATRPVVITPHLGEFARLIDEKVAATVEGRVEQAVRFVAATGVVLLLKGTPTVIVSSHDAPIVVPRGNAVLATGGSGDLLTGLIGALLAQGVAPHHAAAAGAFAHGRAAEMARDISGNVRGVTLDEVLLSLPHVWRELDAPQRLPAGVVAELPGV